MVKRHLFRPGGNLGLRLLSQETIGNFGGDLNSVTLYLNAQNGPLHERYKSYHVFSTFWVFSIMVYRFPPASIARDSIRRRHEKNFMT